MGEPLPELVWLPLPQPVRRDNHIQGEVVHVDRFGNLVTNIPADALAETGQVIVSIKGRRILGLSRTFNDRGNGPPVELVALVGSNGLLEVASPNASAAERLEVGIGEPVTAAFAA
jgi:S-adenosylmethionine hydrolase